MGAGRSRRKGKNGELEAAALLRDHGIDARRNLRETREGEGRDLICPDHPLCIQVKRRKRPAPLSALEEAREGAEEREVSLALVRADRGPWVLVGDAEELLPMVAFWYSELGPGGVKL